LGVYDGRSARCRARFILFDRVFLEHDLVATVNDLAVTDLTEIAMHHPMAELVPDRESATNRRAARLLRVDPDLARVRQQQALTCALIPRPATQPNSFSS
jgi:Holliday junction resolvasome RuvABC ATP-dependent DNA helicase subunit